MKLYVSINHIIGPNNLLETTLQKSIELATENSNEYILLLISN